MATQDGPKYPGIEDGLVFCFDPKNRDCWSGPISGSSLVNNIECNLENIGGTELEGAITTEGYIEVDGTDDWIHTGNIVVGTNFSMGGWVTTTEFSNNIFLASLHYHGGGGDYDGNFIYRLTDATTIAFASYDGQGNEEYAARTVSTISSGDWFNLFCTCNGSTMSLYFNGVKVGTSFTHTKALDDLNNGGLVIGAEINVHGAGHSNNDWNGKIGPCILYNRELSAAEVLTNYNRLKGRFGL